MDQELETRINKLESKVVLYRRVGYAILGGATCLIALAATQAASRTIITANEFRLVDSKGRITAALVPHSPWMFQPNLAQTEYDSTAMFYLAGPDGKARVVISSAPEGSGCGVSLLDCDGKTRLELTLDADGPSVMCYDRDEKAIPMANWQSK